MTLKLTATEVESLPASLIDDLRKHYRPGDFNHRLKNGVCECQTTWLTLRLSMREIDHICPIRIGRKLEEIGYSRSFEMDAVTQFICMVWRLNGKPIDTNELR